MGDRTTVDISIRTVDYKKLLKKLGGKDKLENEIYCEINEDKDLTTLTGEEINYAEWDELESLLKDEKIEFDKRWAEGSNYESGESFYRLNVGGEIDVISQVTSSKELIFEVLQEILELVDKGKDIKQLKRYLKKEMDKICPPIPSLLTPNSVKFITED